MFNDYAKLLITWSLVFGGYFIVAPLSPLHAQTTSVTYIGNYELMEEEGKAPREVVRVGGGMGKVVKSREIGSLAKKKDWEYAYYTTDVQGSTRQELTDATIASSTIPQPNSYYAYGMPINPAYDARTQKVEDTYTGQKKDEETGLMYYNARYYNPQSGLFVQADGVDDGQNKYQYVAGNPVRNIDPSGNADQVNDGGGLTGFGTLFFSGSPEETGVPSARDVAGFVPIVGDALDIVDTAKSCMNLSGDCGTNVALTAVAIGNPLPMPKKTTGWISDTFTKLFKRGEKAATDNADEIITLYRGVDEVTERHLPGGMRKGLTVEQMKSQDYTELVSQIDDTYLSPEVLARYEELYKSGKFSREQVDAYLLAQSGMDISPYLSATTDVNVARRFGPNVIEYRVPKSHTANIDELSYPIYRHLHGMGDSGEAEIAIIGEATQWVRSISSP